MLKSIGLNFGLEDELKLELVKGLGFWIWVQVHYPLATSLKDTDKLSIHLTTVVNYTYIARDHQGLSHTKVISKKKKTFSYMLVIYTLLYIRPN